MTSTVHESNERKEMENYIKLLRVLHRYNECQDVSKLREILDLRDINYQIPQNGLTPSHLIADTNEWSNSNFAEFLIDHGADPTIANHKGQTSVHWIAIKSLYNPGCLSKTQSINFLLTTIHIKNQNTTNFKDSYGFSHFHAACMINNVQIIEFFINNGVSVDEAVNMDSPKYPGYTPLHFAIRYRHVDLVELLLNHGANLIKDSRGMSPLHVLIQKNMEIIQYAKLHRTLVGEFEERFYVYNVINEKELFPEIVETNEKMIRSILSKTSKMVMDDVGLLPFYEMRTLEDDSFNWTQSDINKCIPMDSACWPGYNALHFAARFDIDTVELLLEKGADIEAKDADGVTPFNLCVGRYSVEDIYYIISSHNVWRNILLSDGKTKLLELVLALRNPGDLTKFLNGIQQDINSISIPRDSPLWPGFTILHLVVMLSKKGTRFRVAGYVPLFYDHFAMKEAARLDVAKQTDYTVDQLIRRPDELIGVCLNSGADVTTQDPNGSIPIHLAFQRMDLGSLYFLFIEQYTRNSNPTDNDDLSLLHVACALEKVTLVKRLIAAGADLNAMVSSSFQWDPEVKYFHKLDSDKHLHVWPGSTPLHIALMTNFKNGRKVVKLLMKAGADLHAKDAFGLLTPLHRLTKLNPKSEIVDDDLLSQFITRDCVVVGLSYLHIAALHKYPKTMKKKLLDLGANVNSVIAVRDRTNENLSRDHYRRATCDRTTKFSYFMLHYFKGNTPLHMALERRYDEEDYDVAKILVCRGADVLVKNYEGIFPLRKMLEEGGYGGLLKHCKKRCVLIGDDEEQRLIDEVGVTKLHIACRLCDDDLVRDCLKDGRVMVDVQIRDEFGIWSGYTPLHLLVASFCHNLREPFEHERQTNRAMRLLLKHGLM